MRALKKTSPAALCLALLLVSVDFARAAPCLDQSYDGRFLYGLHRRCPSRPSGDVHAERVGTAYATFERLAASLGDAHRTIAFAMNAGMYEADLSPVGLLIERGAIRHPATIRDGVGNFS